MRAVRNEAHIRELKLWAFERADYRNVHFRGPAHPQAWMLEDFIGGGKQPDAGGTIAAEQARITRLSEEMRSGIPAALPAWAQMTPEELAKKQNREKNRGR